MKQTSNKNRSNSRHGRFNNNRRTNNLITRNTVFDSSSPSGRNRGTSQQLVEKYMSLAKDAKNQDDRVLYETYLQYADHYGRLLAMAIANEQPKQPSVPVDEVPSENVSEEKEIPAENQEKIETVENTEMAVEKEQEKKEACEKTSEKEDVVSVKKPKVQRKPRKVVAKKEKVVKDDASENVEDEKTPETV